MNKKQLLRILVDLISWCVASTLATLLRFEAELPAGMATEMVTFSLVAALTAVTINFGFSLYTGKYASSSLEEVIAICS